MECSFENTQMQEKDAYQSELNLICSIKLTDGIKNYILKLTTVISHRGRKDKD